MIIQAFMPTNAVMNYQALLAAGSYLTMELRARGCLVTDGSWFWAKVQIHGSLFWANTRSSLSTSSGDSHKLATHSEPPESGRAPHHRAFVIFVINKKFCQKMVSACYVNAERLRRSLKFSTSAGSTAWVSEDRAHSIEESAREEGRVHASSAA